MGGYAWIVPNPILLTNLWVSRVRFSHKGLRRLDCRRNRHLFSKREQGHDFGSSKTVQLLCEALSWLRLYLICVCGFHKLLPTTSIFQGSFMQGLRIHLADLKTFIRR